MICFSYASFLDLFSYLASSNNIQYKIKLHNFLFTRERVIDAE